MVRKILAVDDDVNFLSSLKRNLEDIGYYVDTISNSSNAIKEIINNEYSCILLDVKMPGINGLELLEISLQKHPSTPVLMVSGQSSIKIAVEAIKLGAFDFIEKPIDVEKLHITIKNAVNKHTLTLENENLLSELKDNFQIVGKSKQINYIIEQIKMIADTPAKVLVQGETGTGKELVAWAIHHNSSRKVNPYIKINCAAIPGELLESELFGHSKGSFTGATDSKKGKFIAANEGTLFLDEIGDMSLELQSKILRVLESNEVDIIGENSPKKINVRIIAATNQDLETKVKNGSFREDLYYRLNVLKIVIPPLRNRVDDIIPLSYHFLSKYNQVYNKNITNISKEALQILLKYEWKGNARELRNIIEKAIIYTTGNSIGIIEIKKAMGYLEIENEYRDHKYQTLKEAKSKFERKYILDMLDKNNWKIIQTAEELGIDRTNLFKKMQNLDIEKIYKD